MDLENHTGQSFPQSQPSKQNYNLQHQWSEFSGGTTVTSHARHFQTAQIQSPLPCGICGISTVKGARIWACIDMLVSIIVTLGWIIWYHMWRHPTSSQKRTDNLPRIEDDGVFCGRNPDDIFLWQIGMEVLYMIALLFLMLGTFMPNNIMAYPAISMAPLIWYFLLGTMNIFKCKNFTLFLGFCGNCIRWALGTWVAIVIINISKVTPGPVNVPDSSIEAPTLQGDGADAQDDD